VHFALANPPIGHKSCPNLVAVERFRPSEVKTPADQQASPQAGETYYLTIFNQSVRGGDGELAPSGSPQPRRIIDKYSTSSSSAKTLKHFTVPGTRVRIGNAHD
jgi:hypothetical protein